METRSKANKRPQNPIYVDEDSMIEETTDQNSAYAPEDDEYSSKIREESLPQNDTNQLPRGFAMDEEGNICSVSYDNKNRPTFVKVIDVLEQLYKDCLESDELDDVDPETMKEVEKILKDYSKI